MQLFPLLTSTLPWRTRGSSQNTVDNRILYSGLIAKVQMQHICALLLFALICHNSSCHKFQQITKEKVNRVDKPLEMFIWRIKEGKNSKSRGRHLSNKLRSMIQKAQRSQSKCFSQWDKGTPRQGMAPFPSQKRDIAFCRKAAVKWKELKCGNRFLWVIRRKVYQDSKSQQLRAHTLLL